MAEELRILMLEDVEEEAGLIERILKRESLPFVRLRVDTPAEFVKALDTFKPDVVLSDHALPQFNSIEALRICREKGLPIPFILVTGTVSEDFAVNCLKQGVDDYILKDNLSRLPAAIVNAISQRKSENSRLEAELKLRDQNEELIKTNAALRKTNMELDNFVYSVSHNLRAPLTTILGLVNLARMDLRRGKPNDEEYFGLIEKSIHNLDTTIKQILDYSQNARLEPEVEQIDFKAIFDQTIDRLAYTPHFGDIDKSIAVTGNAVFKSDPYRVKTILQNVISNSLRFCDPGKNEKFMRISVTITPTDAVIVINDNGIGIPNDQIPLVFKMFYRASDRSTGAGLGLYLAQECAAALKGAIAIESRQDEGTTVKVKLPNMMYAH